MEVKQKVEVEGNMTIGEIAGLAHQIVSEDRVDGRYFVTTAILIWSAREPDFIELSDFVLEDVKKGERDGEVSEQFANLEKLRLGLSNNQSFLSKAWYGWIMIGEKMESVFGAFKDLGKGEETVVEKIDREDLNKARKAFKKRLEIWGKVLK